MRTKKQQEQEAEQKYTPVRLILIKEKIRPSIFYQLVRKGLIPVVTGRQAGTPILITPTGRPRKTRWNEHLIRTDDIRRYIEMFPQLLTKTAPETRKYDCEFYGVCLTNAAMKNSEILGCDSCQKFSPTELPIGLHEIHQKTI